MKQNTEMTLHSDQTASEAVREILRFLLDAFESPLAGTLDGLDPEALHDFRVAARRTRSAIGQLKRALPPDAATHFAGEFKWLGDVTGDCRDLDVWILDLENRHRKLPKEEVADHSMVIDLVHGARARAHAKVVRGLSSVRFRQLLIDWRIFLADEWTTIGTAPDAETAVEEFSRRRIRKAFKRVQRRSLEIDKDPDAAALHRLRISAKKYRYLLEFFRSLFEPKQISARIRKLKVLQDVLGELNDLDFQRSRLVAISSELEIAPDSGALTLVGCLQSDVDHRQRQLRLSVPECLGPVVSRSPSLIPPMT